MASEEQCITNEPSLEDPIDKPFLSPTVKLPDKGQSYEGGCLLSTFEGTLEEPTVNKFENNPLPFLKKELENKDGIQSQIDAKDIKCKNFPSDAECECSLSLNHKDKVLTCAVDQKCYDNADRETALVTHIKGEEYFSPDEKSLIVSCTWKEDLSTGGEDNDKSSSGAEDEKSFSLPLENENKFVEEGTHQSVVDEEGNILFADVEREENYTSVIKEEKSEDDSLHGELEKLSVIHSLYSTDPDVQRKESNDNCSVENQWHFRESLEDESLFLELNEALIRKEGMKGFPLDSDISLDLKTYDTKLEGFAQRVTEYVGDVVSHIQSIEKSHSESPKINEIHDGNDLSDKLFPVNTLNSNEANEEQTIVSEIETLESKVDEISQTLVENTPKTNEEEIKESEESDNCFPSNKENCPIEAESARTTHYKEICKSSWLSESNQSLIDLTCTKREHLSDASKCAIDCIKGTPISENCECLKDNNSRKSSLQLQSSLPTISEARITVDESETSEEYVDEVMDFNLHNSPMLRRSRKTSEELSRRDCRFIFSDEENNNNNSNDREEIPPKQHFTSLRDSLDIAKHSNQFYDLPDDEEETKHEQNSNLLTSDELPIVVQSSPSPSEKLLPYIGRSVGIKKKTSIKTDKDSNRRRVSFPEDDSRLITSYLEPVNPWYLMNDVSTDVISEAYIKSCERHKTRALPIVLQQIAALPVGVGGRIECLSLRNQKLEAGQCECLEEIFRRVQFQTLDFEGCELDDDTAIPLFDMVEFYDSAIQLNISCNNKIGNRGWQACARMMKRTPSLRMLEARNTNLSEQNMPIICKALRLGTRLHTLHLENCNLTGRPLVNLAGALRLNDTVTDLYLSDNRLGSNDCIQLGNLVRANKALKLLDLRNNNIQDTGCSHICKEIAEQQGQQINPFLRGSNGGDQSGSSSVRSGLTTLVLWNNHITVHAVHYFSVMLQSNVCLETLNLGRNNLTSEGILLLKNSLIRNRSLRRLGLQATRIGNEGAVALAECIADNTGICRLDLRENSIQVAGLLALSRSLKLNTTIVQLDLDANPRAEPSPELSEQHLSLHSEIRALCQKNQTNAHLRESTGHQDAHKNLVSASSPENRKISLTCETTTSARSDASVGENKRYRSPAPSPSVSPCPSPSLSPSPSPVPSPLKNRFKVFKVSEESGVVSPPPDPATPHSTAAILSTSAPAFLMQSSMGGSLPSLVPAMERPNRFSSGGRFTVTKVPESASKPFKSSLPNSRAMSSPSLIAPPSDAVPAPTIVVSSPNKAVRGFSVETVEAEDLPPCHILERSVSLKERRSGSLELPVTTSASSSISSPSSDSTSPQDDVFIEEASTTTRPKDDVSQIVQRAPLASAEAGSFDSDTDEDDSELTTQSSDSTHSDEVRIATEQNVPILAWESKDAPSPPPQTFSSNICNKK